MSEPSDRMQDLVSQYALAVVLTASSGGGRNPEVAQTRQDLLTAIAELEQREEAGHNQCQALLRAGAELTQQVEKWKRAAVAMYEWGSSFVPELGKTEEDWSLLMTEAAKRADRAAKALGDEWTEAVK